MKSIGKLMKWQNNILKSFNRENENFKTPKSHENIPVSVWHNSQIFHEN
jgi:hypothetical protein